MASWVDAYASPGGDGSEGRPWKELPAGLAKGAVLHLKTGLYPGPWVVPDGVTLIGEGTAVLHGEGPGAVLQATNATVRNLSIQGGGVGLVISGEVGLEGVHFSGHRDAGVVVEAAGAASLTGCVFEGAVEGTTAVAVRGGRARLDGGTFRGGFRRGVESEDGTVALRGATFEGVTEPVHVVGGSAELSDVSAAAGRGPAFFVSRGALTVRHSTVHGQEYGLLTGEGATVWVDGLVVKRPQFVAVALVRSDSRLQHLTLEAPGAHGAIHVLEGTALIEDATVKDAQSLGVLVRQAKATLRRVTIDGVRDDREVDGTGSEGDGLNLRDSRVELDEVRVMDAQGCGVLVTMGAQVSVGTVATERVGVSGLVVERASSVSGRELTVRGAHGPGVSVLEGSSLVLDTLRVSGASEGAVWAECENGSSVRLLTLESTAPRVPSRCVAVQKPAGAQ